MVMDIDPAWVVCVYLVALRLGVLLVMSPIFSGFSGLVTMRVLFTLALSLVLVSGISARPDISSYDLGSVISSSFSELLIGAVMAFGVFAAFGAFSVAGKLLDIQTGFGLGSVFDPVTRAGSPLFSTLLTMVAVAVFFGMDGHHAFMRGIAFSMQQLPPGTALSTLPVDAAIRQFGLMFSLGVALISPVMFCLFLIEGALALMSRVMPQMNVFIVGIPIKIYAGLAMLALMSGSLGQIMGRIYASIFTYWEQVFV